MSQKILLIEDDSHIAKLIKYNLEKAGYECFSVITGEDGLEVLDREDIDLIILDIMLPKMDGFETCKLIKQEKSSAAIPIIMLTAKGEEVDRIIGFELGADDYVLKPFSPRELLLRIKAILKRGKIKEHIKDVIAFNDLRIDIPRHKVSVNNQEIKLTAIEFDLLLTLVKRIGKVQSRDRLLEDVWDIAADVTTRTIDTHVKRLRQKLGHVGGFIETIRGIGYRFREEA